jgi:hypothetical protein
MRRQLERAAQELLRQRGRKFKIIDAGETSVVLATKTGGYLLSTRKDGTPVVEVMMMGEKGEVETVAVVVIP